ncbi:MAG: hypothetical protein U9R49_02380 [Bacteroidota bacterium]|nr:hypothetical protein [Bacteroidota bacterium]
MKKSLIYIAILCSFVHLPALAQERPLILPEESGESLVLLSDREIYGAGEKVYYFAIYGTPGGLKGVPLSTVLYVELINWDGTKQAASKVLITNGGAGGTIGIPENISSGIYYLRAYTKWMRNYPSSTYTYLPLRILNPYSQEMLASPEEGNGKHLTMEYEAETQTGGIVFSGLKDQYGTGEQVEIEIQIPADLRPGRYSLGIAKTPGQSSLSYLMGRTGEAENEAGKI